MSLGKVLLRDKSQQLLQSDRSCRNSRGLVPRALSLASKASKKRMGKQQKGATGPSFPTISKKTSLPVIELKGHEIFQVEGVLTVAESERFIDAAESSGFAHTTSRGAAFGEALRDNSRISVNSAALADSLWRNGGLQEAFEDYRVDGKTAQGLNPNIRFYKYEKGNKFGKHVDDSVRVGSRETKYTLLIYLSGGIQKRKAQEASTDSSRALAALKGGETLFYGGKRCRLVAAVAPRPGLALLHLHGDDCLEHEGAEVQSGVKYVMRSDVLF